MNIEHFDDLLRAARAQPQPQCLLLVFVQVELPEDSSDAERADFEAGQGGALVPVMCVDLAPDRIAVLTGFEQLRAEADGRGAGWEMVLAGAMGGQAGRAPDDAAVGSALDRLVQRVQMGDIDGLIPFNRKGEALELRTP
jgi:hypothetical protein